MRLSTVTPPPQLEKSLRTGSADIDGLRDELEDAEDQLRKANNVGGGVL